jgi:hypothetical protein
MRRTRISAVAASTPTSTKCAPKVHCWNCFSRSPYFHLVLGRHLALGRDIAQLDGAPTGRNGAVGELRARRIQAKV